MSTKAYRIETKVVDGRCWSSPTTTPTFDCSGSFKLFEYFLNHEHTCDQTSSEGVGIISVSVGAVKEAMERAKELEIPDDELVLLRKDYEECVAEGEEKIDYECL